MFQRSGSNLEAKNFCETGKVERETTETWRGGLYKCSGAFIRRSNVHLFLQAGLMPHSRRTIVSIHIHAESW